MGTAREDLYGNLRRSLGVTGQEAPRRQVVSDRISAAPKGLIPARGRLEGAALVELFVTQAEMALATVHLLASRDEVPSAIADFLRERNLPATLRRGDDPRLEDMPWEGTALEVSKGRSHGADLNAVSHAFGGVSETGTLLLVSGGDNPTSLNFLPDNHIVVVDAADIVGDYESLWGRLRERYGKGTMPRVVNLITGPSRSADIEQTLFVGAHGPRRLHVLVINGTVAGPGLATTAPLV